MAVPVDLHVLAGRVDDLADETREPHRADRRRVPDRIGDAHPPRPRFDRRGVEPAQILGIRPRGVLGHVHDRQPFGDRELDRLDRQLQDAIELPVFGVLAHRRSSR